MTDRTKVNYPNPVPHDNFAHILADSEILEDMPTYEYMVHIGMSRAHYEHARASNGLFSISYWDNDDWTDWGEPGHPDGTYHVSFPVPSLPSGLELIADLVRIAYSLEIAYPPMRDGATVAAITDRDVWENCHIKIDLGSLFN